MDAQQFVRFFLPCYFVAYVLICGVLAVVRARRRYGVDPFSTSRPDPVISLGESYRNVLFGTALVMVAANALRPAWLSHLGRLPDLHAPAVQWAGVVLLLGSLALVSAAQAEMKGAWRFGCDRGAAPNELITTGLYARTRNPIYLGMTSTAVGLFLALPNAVSLAIASLTFLLLQVRIRVEEQYLTQTCGEAFIAYCRGTPRWLLRLGGQG